MTVLTIFSIFLSGTMSAIPNNKSALMEDFSTRIFLMFSLLLILCLIATFSVNTTPIHKVIALLFLSVVTVLFWVSSTHFLFVYIVYIMAFIGAVLMLFLSVVLMLPISATSQFSVVTLFVSGASAKELLPPVTLRPEGMIFPEQHGGFIYWFILFYMCFFFITKAIRIGSVFPLKKSLLETYNEARVQHAIWAYKEIITKSKFYDMSKKVFFIYPAYANQFFYLFFPLIQKVDGRYKLNWKFNLDEAFYSKVINWHNFDPQNSTFLDTDDSANYWYRSYGRNLHPYFSVVFLTPEHPLMQNFARYIGLRDVSKLLGLCRKLNFFLYFRLRLLFIFYSWTHTQQMKKFLRPLTLFFRRELPLLRSFLADLVSKVRRFFEKNLKKTLYFFFTKAFLEICLQICVVTGFLFMLIPTAYLYLQEKKDSLYSPNITSEVSGGLGNIKELLYEHYNLLLLFSTLVLLVALLGAAIMTRNKR